MFLQHSLLALMLLVLANSLVLSPRSQSLEAGLPKTQPLLKRREQRRKAEIVGGAIGKGSEEFCTSTQVLRLIKDLEWMHELAASASEFLLQPNSHTSAAYIAWFGESYASQRWATEMRTDVYKSIWNMGNRVVINVASVEHGTYDGIVFGCFPPDPKDCKSDTFAVSVDNRYSYVMVCPEYFKVSTNYEEAFLAWRDKRKNMDVGGHILLHEMLHQRIVVGNDWYASDYKYTPEQCLKLPDWKKRRNAENFALFALEVKANPERAKLQVDMKSSKAKSEIALGLLGHSNTEGS
ncbi:zincin [Colletotrichum falcatum]|nr:zincin [Colletotrichum falcatum]